MGNVVRWSFEYGEGHSTYLLIIKMTIKSTARSGDKVRMAMVLSVIDDCRGRDTRRTVLLFLCVHCVDGGRVAFLVANDFAANIDR